MVEFIRVSYGTAVAMGLKHGKMLARPTAAYLMTYWPGHCRNNCAFCVQARESGANLKKLSRVTWPAFELEDVLKALPNGGFSRLCLQTIDYSDMVEDVLELLDRFAPLNLPVSVSITPVGRDVLKEFKERGVDYIGVGLDAASERIYKSVKDSLYSWDEMWAFTRDVLDVFGLGKAFVHLIVGLGETDREMVETMARLYGMKAEVSLFAFTPVKGTRLENAKPPSLMRYRRIQLARYLLEKNLASPGDFKFDNGGNLTSFGIPKEELLGLVSPEAFATHGCPGCNRPYYNERPKKEPYNFPVRPKKEYVTGITDAIL